MPRLLVFNRSYYPDLGATGQLLSELCEDLVARHGWDVTVVAGRPTVTLTGRASAKNWIPVRREMIRGVTVLRAAGTRLSKGRFVGRATNYVSYFASAALAAGWAHRPDVVMCLTDPPILGLAALAWARRWRVPFVFLCQDIFPEVAVLLEDFRNERVNRALDRINRFLLGQARAVVALGETMARRLVEGKGAGVEKVTVIHNWADREVVQPEPKKNAFAEAHGLTDRFVVLHSGNLGLSQGLDTVLEAARLLGNLPDLVVVFQGDGVMRETLATRARALRLDNVRFLPYVSKESLRYAFGAADVQIVSLRRGLSGFIVPSKVYGILASRRPYVAAVEAETEVALLTERYDAGLIVPPEDPDALAKAIQRLYEDPTLRERLGTNGYTASALHDRMVAVAKYHRLLIAIVRGRESVSRLTLVRSRQERRRGAPGERDVRVISGLSAYWKRAFDVTLAGIGLVGSSPLWAVIALAIKCEDRGPVFFRDRRVGRGGHTFGVLKFRTMVPDADRIFGPRQATRDDARVTQLGRLLRSTAMDELPQLWNIFRGDMSFVGPRALRPGEIHTRGDGQIVRLDSVPGYRERHAVRPGLTGVAQVYADRDIPPRQKFRYDRLYVTRRSFWLDLRLVALSFWITFRGRWEHQGRKV
jgi:lipopolysaccharide/colanic/teichoic acid biosynthesis glycosyltransferase/glycosyltransferase involved in cell wall biosynthesis